MTAYPRRLRPGEHALPFVSRGWLRYLEMLGTHGADFTGDQVAAIAAEDELATQWSERCDADLARGGSSKR